MTMTPLGLLVEPEVYWRKRISECASRTVVETFFSASLLMIHSILVSGLLREEKAAPWLRAWLNLMDQKNDRSVSTADALQSLAMKFSLASAPWNPLPVGGYTGTGMRPRRTQAKKTQIISRPGGYRRIIRAPCSMLPTRAICAAISFVRCRNSA